MGCNNAINFYADIRFIGLMIFNGKVSFKSIEWPDVEISCKISYESLQRDLRFAINFTRIIHACQWHRDEILCAVIIWPTTIIPIKSWRVARQPIATVIISRRRLPLPWNCQANAVGQCDPPAGWRNTSVFPLLIRAETGTALTSDTRHGELMRRPANGTVNFCRCLSRLTRRVVPRRITEPSRCRTAVLAVTTENEKRIHFLSRYAFKIPTTVCAKTTLRKNRADPGKQREVDALATRFSRKHDFIDSYEAEVIHNGRSSNIIDNGR